MAEGGGGALREILVAFGINVESEGLKALVEQIGEAKGKLKELAEVFGAGLFGEKVREFVEGQIEAGAALKRTAAMLGTGTDELQALQLAAGSAGVPVEDMTNSLRFLNRNMAEAAAGGGETAAVFQKFGVHLKDAKGEMRPAGDVLQDLADHMETMKDPAEKTAAAMKLLGRGGAALIPLLNKGGKAFEEARKSMEELGGGISEEFTEKAEEAEAAQYRLTFATKGLKSMIAAQFLPALVGMAETMTHWVASVIEVAKRTNALQSAFVALKLGAAYMMFMKIVKVLELTKMGFSGAARALMGFAWPILLVGGLYLIFDDLFTLMTGGKSLIGDLLDKYAGVGTASALAQTLRDVWQDITGLWSELGPILKGGMISALTSALDLAEGIARALMGAAHYAAGTAYAIAGNDKKSNESFNSGDKSMHKAVGDWAEAFGADGGEPQAAGAKGGRQPISMARGTKPEEYFAPAPVLRQPMSMTRDSAPTVINQTVKADVRVQTGSGDPNKIADAVADGVADGSQRQLRNAAAALGAGG